MSPSTRVLVVDDDPAFRRMTTIALEASGMEFEVAEDGAQGLEILRTTEGRGFDAVLLDVNMPVLDGWTLLHDIRELGDEVPVLFVTSRTALDERVRGLEMGADDYITKPVEFQEVIARLEAVIRRRRSLPTIEYGELRLDLARRKVERGGNSVDFSPREYDLLFAMVEAEGAPLTKRALLREVWGYEFDPETNVVEVHIGKLRKKLNRFGPNLIETIRGEGYCLLRGES